MQNLDVSKTAAAWAPLSRTLFVPRTEAEYRQLVALLDTLVDEVGENESHPLASLLEVLGTLIEKYEDEHVPELHEGFLGTRLDREHIRDESVWVRTPEHSDLIRIVLERLAKEGLRTMFPVFADILIGIREDREAARREAETRKVLAEVKEQIGTVDTFVQFLEHPRFRKFVEELKAGDSPKIAEESRGIEEIVRNLIASLNNPFQAPLDPQLEAAIDMHALSRAKLVSVDRLPERHGVLIKISDLEVEKSFYPIHFIRESSYALQEYSGVLQKPPLNALFDPPSYRGDPKWICVVAESSRLTLTAHPKLIELDSTRSGSPKLIQKVSIEGLNSTERVEYWPHGDEEPKFLVEMTLGNSVQLGFQDMANTTSPILRFQLSYANGERHIAVGEEVQAGIEGYRK